MQCVLRISYFTLRMNFSMFWIALWSIVKSSRTRNTWDLMPAKLYFICILIFAFCSQPEVALVLILNDVPTPDLRFASPSR